MTHPFRREPIMVLMVSPYYDGHVSGVDAAAGHLSEELVREGLAVVWAACDSFPARRANVDQTLRQLAPLRACNWPEKWFGLPLPLIGPRGLGQLWRQARMAQVIVIHNATCPATLASLIMARLLNTPVLIAQHGGHPPSGATLGNAFFRLALRAFVPLALAGATQVVVSGVSTIQVYGLGSLAMQPKIILNGVDAEVFAPGPRDEARHRLNLPLNASICMFAGRFVENKGLRILRRLAELRADLTFAFAGTGPLDPGRWMLPNVVVLDQLSPSALADLYRASDALLLPSIREGFPLVVKEALACHLPIICSPDVEAADLALRGIVTVAPISLDDLVSSARHLLDAVDSVLNRSAEERKQVAEKGRELCLSRYSWEACGRRYADLLATLVAASRPEPAPGAHS